MMILSYEPSISLHVQIQRMLLAVPDTDSHVTCTTDTDSRVARKRGHHVHLPLLPQFSVDVQT